MNALVAVYRLHAPAADVRERAEAIALEQTVELPRAAVTDPFVEREILGRVRDVRPEPGGTHLAEIAYPLACFGDDPLLLLGVLFGNTSLQPDVELVDLELPAGAARVFGGPRHGIAGIRELAGVRDRALTAAALKPMGLSPEALADFAATFARAGIDLVKDDQGLVDQETCRFEDRVRAVTRALDRVADETGRRPVYAPYLAGSPRELPARIELLARLGIRAVMVSPMLAGVGLLADLAREGRLVILAHPSWGGAGRVAPELLLGRLFRLLGADASIFPHAGGRFAWREETCRAIADRLREPWHGLAPALPVPAGGMTLDRIPELLRFYGRDVMLLVGGSLYLAEDRLEERARAFVRAVTEASEEVSP